MIAELTATDPEHPPMVVEADPYDRAVEGALGSRRKPILRVFRDGEEIGTVVPTDLGLLWLSVFWTHTSRRGRRARRLASVRSKMSPPPPHYEGEPVPVLEVCCHLIDHNSFVASEMSLLGCGRTVANTVVDADEVIAAIRAGKKKFVIARV